MASTSSRPPIRSAITAGPAKAFSIVTCWSSTIPISSALGSLASRVSARSSPVMYSSVAVMASAFAHSRAIDQARMTTASRHPKPVTVIGEFPRRVLLSNA